MKRLTAILLAVMMTVVMSFAITGCGADKDVDEGTSEPGNTEELQQESEDTDITILDKDEKSELEELGDIMAEVLKCYEAGDYDGAEELNAQLPELFDGIPAVSPTAEQLAAYNAKFEEMKGEILEENLESDQPLNMYVDIDNDEQAEYLLVTGTCEADYEMHIYKTDKDNKCYEVGTAGASHCYFCVYPAHNGLIRVTQHMGVEDISIISIEDGKVVDEDFADGGEKDYIRLGCCLTTWE